MKTEKTDLLLAQLLLEKQKQIFELQERVEALKAQLEKAKIIAQDALVTKSYGDAIGVGLDPLRRGKL